jgi:hypothetical protein
MFKATAIKNPVKAPEERNEPSKSLRSYGALELKEQGVSINISSLRDVPTNFAKKEARALVSQSPSTETPKNSSATNLRSHYQRHSSSIFLVFAPKNLWSKNLIEDKMLPRRPKTFCPQPGPMGRNFRGRQALLLL